MNLTLKKKTGCLLIIRTNALKDWLSEGDNHLGKVRAQCVCHAIYLFLSVFVLLNNSYLWYWKYRPLVFALWDICVMEHSSTKRDRSSRFLEQSRVLEEAILILDACQRCKFTKLKLSHCLWFTVYRWFNFVRYVSVKRAQWVMTNIEKCYCVSVKQIQIEARKVLLLNFCPLYKMIYLHILLHLFGNLALVTFLFKTEFMLSCTFLYLQRYTLADIMHINLIIMHINNAL